MQYGRFVEYKEQRDLEALKGKFDLLASCINENEFNHYWETEALPTLLEGGYSTPDELLDVLLEGWWDKARQMGGSALNAIGGLGRAAGWAYAQPGNLIGTAGRAIDQLGDKVRGGEDAPTWKQVGQKIAGPALQTLGGDVWGNQAAKAVGYNNPSAPTPPPAPGEVGPDGTVNVEDPSANGAQGYGYEKGKEKETGQRVKQAILKGLNNLKQQLNQQATHPAESKVIDLLIGKVAKTAQGLGSIKPKSRGPAPRKVMGGNSGHSANMGDTMKLDPSQV